MGIARTYRKSGEKFLANYNYIDLAAGTGFIKYYFATTNTDGTEEYILTENKIYSNKITSDIAGTSSINLNFDLNGFKRPQTIEGKAILTMGVWAKPSTSAGGAAFTTKVDIKIIHYDGTTETTLATGQLKQVNSSTAGYPATEYDIITGKFNINRTHFKVGEILRINVIVNSVRGSGTSSNTDNGKIGHDPKNRDDGIDPSTDPSNRLTASEINLPFKLVL